MNWQTVAVQRLRNYEAKKLSLETMAEQIKLLEYEYTGIRSATSDGMPSSGTNTNKREEMLVGNIAKREELKRNYKIAKGEADWTFVEIMGCPGGCVNGGGQPIQPQYVRDTVDLKAVRAKALYDQDASMEMRKSHLNPVIKEVYDNYFKGGYGCHAAHHALHTSYVGRKKFNF